MLDGPTILANIIERSKQDTYKTSFYVHGIKSNQDADTFLESDDIHLSQVIIRTTLRHQIIHAGLLYKTACSFINKPGKIKVLTCYLTICVLMISPQ
jgi:hypothetical protein